MSPGEAKGGRQGWGGAGKGDNGKVWREYKWRKVLVCGGRKRGKCNCFERERERERENQISFNRNDYLTSLSFIKTQGRSK